MKLLVMTEEQWAEFQNRQVLYEGTLTVTCAKHEGYHDGVAALRAAMTEVDVDELDNEYLGKVGRFQTVCGPARYISGYIKGKA